MTVIERIAQVEQGLPYKRFQELAERLGVSEERLRSALDNARTAPGLEAVQRLLLQLDHGVVV